MIRPLGVLGQTPQPQVLFEEESELLLSPLRDVRYRCHTPMLRPRRAASHECDVVASAGGSSDRLDRTVVECDQTGEFETNDASEDLFDGEPGPLDQVIDRDRNRAEHLDERVAHVRARVR